MIPTTLYRDHEFFVASTLLIVFVVFSTGKGSQIISVSITHLIVSFAVQIVIYKIEITASLAIIKIVYVIGVFIINSVLSMLLHYIS